MQKGNTLTFENGKTYTVSRRRAMKIVKPLMSGRDKTKKA